MSSNCCIIEPDEEGITKASALLKAGKLVAFPTETVYGLGANALNADAVKSIFEAKGRPLTDPLIVHIPKPADAMPLIELSTVEQELFHLLSRAFWPGPLTLIVKASSAIPSLVTANTGFVGVRCPRHALALKLLEEVQLPIAAPSANRFGHVSPTRMEHVTSDLDAKGVHVINGESSLCHTNERISDSSSSSSRIAGDSVGAGGSCEFGIESSVVKIDAFSQQLLIFRQGGITQHQLEYCIMKGLESKLISSTWTVKVIQRTVKMQHGNQSQTQRSTVVLTTTTTIDSSNDKNNNNNFSTSAVDGSTSQDDIIATTTTTGTKEEQEEEGQQAPGQAITHYAPDVPCFIVKKVSITDINDGRDGHNNNDNYDNKSNDSSSRADSSRIRSSSGSSSGSSTGSSSDVDWMRISSSELQNHTVVLDFLGALSGCKHRCLAYRDLSSTGDSAEAARGLFESLRWAELVPHAKRVLISEITVPAAASGNSSSSGGGGGGIKPRVDINDSASTGIASGAVENKRQESSSSSSSSSIRSDIPPEDLRFGLADRIFRAASGVTVCVRIVPDN